MDPVVLFISCLKVAGFWRLPHVQRSALTSLFQLSDYHHQIVVHLVLKQIKGFLARTLRLDPESFNGM